MRDKQKQRKRNKIIGILSRNGLAAQSGSSVIGALLDHQQEKEQVLEENNGYRAFLRKRVLDGRSLVMPFSPEEDHALLRLVKSYGSRWAMFAKILTDRFHTQINADDNHTAGQKSVVVMQKRTPSVVYTRYFQLLRDYSGTSRTAFSDLQATSDSTTEDNRDLVDQPLRCYRRREKRRFSKRRTWSKEEQAELTKVVEEMLGEEHGFISWNYVAEKMKKYNRNSAQCQYYWTQICGTHLRHTPFAVSEDRVLWLFIIGSRSRSHSIASQPVPTIASLMTGYLEDSNLLSAAGSESSSLDSRALTCRSSPQILNRIKRFKKVLQWLREEAKVEASEELFDLVRGLTNSPSAFKIRSDNLK
ncbi:hypothetical protein FB639_001843 [Coemansia asiatica]|nr:hypothetical protein FB639_001843 [Coemansia asiatica]